MPAPSLAELHRQKARIEAEIAEARAAGNDEGLWEGLKQFNIVDDQIDLYPYRLSRWSGLSSGRRLQRRAQIGLPARGRGL